MSTQEEKNKSAIKVNKGIDQPPAISPSARKNFRKYRKKQLQLPEYIEGIKAGNRSILSKAITLIESSLPAHQELAQQIIEACLPFTGNATRVGITGVPGVGKSTFIEALGNEITSHGHKLAVLAIDPSSERSKGSILGDKTRMETLSTNKNAFIRPSPSAGSLGGVARKTRESMLLCEAAGFDIVFIETVGVGQSETAVHSMVDYFLLLMLAGAGDELQGIKRGIMEMADAIAINKADGNNKDKANQAKAEYSGALHLFPPTPSGWTPKVVTCSALHNIDIDKVWQTVEDYRKLTQKNNYWTENRNGQAKYWMYETINEQLKNSFYQNQQIKSMVKQTELDVLNDRKSSFQAAHELLNSYFKQK
ncbi:MAG: methylmalonyl Co-A mutase-associated GTPase MeaB [Salinivirgaceae bacterium]|jgi:LAO/AO transport system kinase|nr:methylmalonyl Co-A mutase-associated GTPase MeaB [Salinivirgaceae bacterium]